MSHGCLPLDGRERAGESGVCPDCLAYHGIKLAQLVLEYDKNLSAWAAHPSATAPVDDTYATMKQLAQQILEDG